MNPNLVNILNCPYCHAHQLSVHSFENDSIHEIKNGILFCQKCNNWYPIEDGLLELLTGDLIYQEDRLRFSEKFIDQLSNFGASIETNALDPQQQALQRVQQSHFDWYAENTTQNYSAYELQPFWKSVDKLTFDKWKSEIVPGSLLLDVGCAEGRSIFKVMDLDINVIGFDISKQLVRQAQDRYKKGTYRADAQFFVADATTFPIIDASLDYVLIYGVLHHLPEPEITCKEINRVLKPGGLYFGSENNQSVFRSIFDLLQKIFPIWHEEAGPESMLSKKKYTNYFHETSMRNIFYTAVFLPPHFYNLLPEKTGYKLMKFSDSLCQKIPGLRNNGGLVVIRGEKQ